MTQVWMKSRQSGGQFSRSSERNAMADTISQVAENVLKTLGMWRLPVNPFEIAKQERIILAPGTYGEQFDARIEYLPDERRFVIYYKAVARSDGRIRFSLGHELGHYYLEHHQD